MANEIALPGITSGWTVYAIVFNAVSQVWQTTTSTWVTYVTANRANYDIALTELGTASGIYAGNFPAVVAGVYSVLAYRRVGATPVEPPTDPFIGGDGRFEWDGTAVLSLSGLATMLLDLADGVETGYTVRQALRLIAASIGTVTGAPAHPLFRNLANNKTRLDAVCDADGNRTVTFDAT